MPKRRIVRRIILWGGGSLVLIVLAVVAIVAVPIFLHRDAGLSSQPSYAAGSVPSTVVAHGDDGRDRTVSILTQGGGSSANPNVVRTGERIVVKGSGYDSTQGIYVAVCQIPADRSTKPSPCIGGVPKQTAVASASGETGSPSPTAQSASRVDWLPSYWINDDWAWRLVGARAYDDRGRGTFTAYIELSATSGGLDCTKVRCALYTRNDHTALADRVQDVAIPLQFER